MIACIVVRIVYPVVLAYLRTESARARRDTFTVRRPDGNCGARPSSDRGRAGRGQTHRGHGDDRGRQKGRSYGEE